MIELWRVAVAADGTAVRYAALATAATIALHLRHVAFGLRNERPPAGGVGPVRSRHRHRGCRGARRPHGGHAVCLACRFGAHVVRGPAAPLIVAAITLAPLLLAQTLQAWQVSIDSIAGLPEWYLVLAVAWRTVTLYVPVQLIAMIRQLEADRLKRRERN